MSRSIAASLTLVSSAGSGRGGGLIDYCLASDDLAADVARLRAAGLTVGTLSSAINGIDFSWFPVVATVANAAWLIGVVALSVSLWRAGRVHRGIAATLWLTMPLSIFGSQLGGGIPCGAILLALGALLLRNALDRRQ